MQVLRSICHVSHRRRKPFDVPPIYTPRVVELPSSHLTIIPSDVQGNLGRILFPPHNTTEQVPLLVPWSYPVSWYTMEATVALQSDHSLLHIIKLSVVVSLHLLDSCKIHTVYYLLRGVFGLHRRREWRLFVRYLFLSLLLSLSQYQTKYTISFSSFVYYKSSHDIDFVKQEIKHDSGRSSGYRQTHTESKQADTSERQHILHQLNRRVTLHVLNWAIRYTELLPRTTRHENHAAEDANHFPGSWTNIPRDNFIFRSATFGLKSRRGERV